MINSNIRPEDFTIGVNSAVIAYGITEDTNEEGVTTYSYQTAKYPATDETILAKVKEKLEAKASKEDKVKKLDNLVVTTNTVPFDADNTSINYMSSVLSVANFRMLEAMVAGTDVADAYNAVFKTTIAWRNANNTNSNVQLETVAEALENCMAEVGTVKTDSTYSL